MSHSMLGKEPEASSTPLAPSVEKAYYRKCIELKRRLNEVEASNDEAKVKRLRLDRAIMKMRLERAFLLEQLSKRMEHNIDGSEGSGDEGMATPPPDRPHRDKRRRGQDTKPASGAKSSTTKNDTANSPSGAPTNGQAGDKASQEPGSAQADKAEDATHPGAAGETPSGKAEEANGEGKASAPSAEGANGDGAKQDAKGGFTAVN